MGVGVGAGLAGAEMVKPPIPPLIFVTWALELPILLTVI